MHNLQTIIVSFQDQEKLLQEAVFSLAVSMNAYTNKQKLANDPRRPTAKQK